MWLKGNNVLIYIIKQDIHIYVPSSWPNGWIEWAEILFNKLMSSLGVTQAEKIKILIKIFFKNLTFFKKDLKKILRVMPSLQLVINI